MLRVPVLFFTASANQADGVLKGAWFNLTGKGYLVDWWDALQSSGDRVSSILVSDDFALIFKTWEETIVTGCSVTEGITTETVSFSDYEYFHNSKIDYQLLSSG